jgi:hypothetical protein
MKNLTLDDIQKAIDTEPVDFFVEEWGGSISIGKLTVQERLDFDAKHCDEKGIFNNLNDPGLVYDLLSLCIRNSPSGDRMFVDGNIEVLKGKSAKVVNKIFLKALSVNYFSEESADAVKKNSVVAS